MKRVFFTSLLIILALNVHAKIVLPALFSNNLVLQQNTYVNIWGNADPIQTIQIKTSWNNQIYNVVADRIGHWKTKIKTSKADNNLYFIEFNDNAGTIIKLTDVLMGEVWLCSGQSNMDVKVKSANNPDIEVLDANYPRIRFFEVPNNPSLTPVDNVMATWEGTNPVSVLNLPAVAFFYARNLYKHLNVPVGIIHAAMGSSSQEAWLSEEYIKGIGYDEKLLSDARNGLLAADFKLQQIPTTLYNGMFKPLIPFTVNGVCWYQGENNSKTPKEYKYFLNSFIKSWRIELEQPGLPFIITQLSSYKTKNVIGWPLVQEQQYKISEEVPNVATVLTYDLGDSINIHPKNKQDVGFRYCLAAKKIAYGEDVIAQGPVMKSYSFVGTKAQIIFKNIGIGLRVKDGITKINNFMLAGADKVFYPAEAILTNNETVEVSCSSVALPKFIRYAFVCFNPNVNLYNSAGLPAVPFRTDEK